MLKHISREQLIGAWVATLILLMAISVVAGVAVTTSSVALWLITGIVPAAVIFLLWHGAPALTVGQLLGPKDELPNGRA